MSTYLEQVATHEARIAQLTKDLGDTAQAAKDWQTRADSMNCTGDANAEKSGALAACRADRQESYNKAAHYRSRVEQIKVELDSKKATLQQIHSTERARVENETTTANAQAKAAVNLASQGISAEALEIAARGQAESDKAKAAAIANAEMVKAEAAAKTILDKGSVDAQNSAADADAARKQRMMIGAAVALVIVVVAIIVAMRFIKRNSKKS